MADYSSTVDKLCSAVSSSRSGRVWIEKYIKAIDCHSGSISAGAVPSWVGFFPKLLEGPKASNSFQNFSIREEVSNFGVPFDIFSVALRHAANWLFQEIGVCHGKLFSERGELHFRAAIKSWFIERSIKSSRYVLYLSQKSSGVSYSKWSRRFFCGDTPSNPWNDIAVEYPVLIRQLAELYTDTLLVANELINRLSTDREEISVCFGIPHGARLDSVIPGLSDPHRGGRSVMRLRFLGGQSLIYKPKSLEIEAAVNAFAEKAGDIFGLHSLKVLAKDDYGWVEDAGPPLDPGEPRADWRTLGLSTAFYWLLNATDLHAENVKPAAEGVVSLDLETLLAAPVETDTLRSGPRWRHHSISATLLFDSSLFAHQRAHNISGFDPEPRNSAPSSRLTFCLKNDEIEAIVSPPVNIERSPAICEAYRDSKAIAEFLSAFRQASNIESRQKLIDFVESLSDNCRLRLVLRDTFFYEQVHERMRQPKFLRDGALLALDLLALHAGVSAEASRADALHRIVDDEIVQLLQGDIPYFSYFPRRLDLYLSDGRTESIFKTDSISHALEKMVNVGLSDVEEQSALIRIALGGGPPPPCLTLEKPVTEAASLSDWLAKLAHVVTGSAICPSDEPSRWLSLYGDVSGSDLRVGVGDRGFFGGSWGILLAIQAAEKVLLSGGHLGKTLQLISNFLDEDASSWKNFIDNGCQPAPGPHDPIGLAGIGGSLFAQAELIRLNPDRWCILQEIIEEDIFTAQTEHDKWRDVIGGAAGLIFGLERVLQLRLGERVEERAMELVQSATLSLIAASEPHSGGLVWRVPGERKPLLGYAHGWAGIVTALATARKRLAFGRNISAIDSCLSSALIPVELELAETGTWHDHRFNERGTAPLNRSWCNGIPGFLRGLAELEASWSPTLSKAAFSLKNMTWDRVGSGEALRFCCGEMGCIDLLLDIQKRNEKDSVRKHELEERAAVIVGNVVKKAGHPVASLQPELAFPGLFQGQSGILYTGCRLLYNDLPSLSGQLELPHNCFPNITG